MDTHKHQPTQRNQHRDRDFYRIRKLAVRWRFCRMWNVQQQTPDLSFDGLDATKHAAVSAENGGGQVQEEPAALIPTVGDGCRHKTARGEQAEQDQQ